MEAQSDYEDLIYDVGKVGCYHIYLFFVLGLFALRISFTVIIYLFAMGEDLSYTCNWQKTFFQLNDSLLSTSVSRVNNSFFWNTEMDNFTLATLDDAKCSLDMQITNISFLNGFQTREIIPCTDWTFHSPYYGRTLFKEFHLVCDRYYLVSITQGSYWLGMIAGVFMGPLADIYGRKKTILLACFIETLSAILMIFSVNIWMYISLRFLSGVAHAALKLPLVLFQEIVHERYRAMTGNLWWLKWVIGYCMAPGIAYFLRDWQYLQLYGAVICCCYISYYWLIPESPRWLLLNGQTERAQKVIDKIARWNKVASPDLSGAAIKIDKTPGRLWHLFSTIGLIKKSTVLFYAWFANSLLFYGISLNESVATDDIYLSVLLMGLSELPGYVTGYIMSDKLGRKLSMILLLFSCSALLIILPFSKGIWYCQTILAISSKIACSASFSILIVFTMELFNTGLRSSAVNVGNCMARLSGICAPFIIKLDRVTYYMPNLTLALVGILCGSLTFLLPETKGRALPQTIAEAELQYEENIPTEEQERLKVPQKDS